MTFILLEITLFVNETIKLNENLDFCEEKKMGEI